MEGGEGGWAAGIPIRSYYKRGWVHSGNPLEDNICALSASEVMHPTKGMLGKKLGGRMMV